MMDEEFSVDATVQQLEIRLNELGAADAGSRGAAEELVRLLMRLYGAGLGRVIEILRGTGSEEIVDRLAEDRLLGSLLLLHGLHPRDAETRVRASLHRLERGLESYGLELAGIEEGVARVTVVRHGRGAPPAGLAESIERAVTECAPELAGVEVQGLASASLVQIAPIAT